MMTSHIYSKTSSHWAAREKKQCRGRTSRCRTPAANHNPFPFPTPRPSPAAGDFTMQQGADEMEGLFTDKNRERSSYSTGSKGPEPHRPGYPECVRGMLMCAMLIYVVQMACSKCLSLSPFSQ